MDGLARGLGFFLVLVSLGAIQWASNTIILAALPPGAFIALSMLIALHQAIQKILKRFRSNRQPNTRDRRVRRLEISMNRDIRAEILHVLEIKT